MPKSECPECGAPIDYGFIRELEEFLYLHKTLHPDVVIEPVDREKLIKAMNDLSIRQGSWMS